MTDAELAAQRALCVSEDLSTWPLDKLYGALYQLHAALPRALDEIEYQRGLIARLTSARDCAIVERDGALQRSQMVADHLNAMRKQWDKHKADIVAKFDEAIAAADKAVAERDEAPR